MDIGNFRMVGVEVADEGRLACSLVGNQGLSILRISDVNCCKTPDSEEFIIDMKATGSIEKDENGKFKITHLVNETRGKDAWGIIGFTNEETKEATFYEFRDPFAVRNRETVTYFTLNSKYNIHIKFEQSPESECTPDTPNSENKIENAPNSVNEGNI